MLVTLRGQRVKCISIRAVPMTDLMFSMLDEREERQTNRQTTLTWTIFKKPDASPEQYLTF